MDYIVFELKNYSWNILGQFLGFPGYYNGKWSFIFNGNLM